MNTEPYTGNVAGMKETPWLGSEDLLGIESGVNLTISAVNKNTDVKVEAGRTEPTVFSLAFDGAAKQLWLNAVNRKTLSRAFGAETQNWIGKTVRLIVVDGVRKPGGKRGETTTGLRIVVD